MDSNDPFSASPDRFATTQWNLVSSAGKTESPEATAALHRLCEIYWRPLYAFARRKTDSSDDAQDLTQAFFAELLAKNYVASAERNRGKFRSFLLASFQHFMFKQWERKRTKKRGGDIDHLSLDFHSADSHFDLALSCDLTPEQLFDQQWVLVLLEQILEQLQSHYEDSGRSKLFEQLKPCVIGDHSGNTYAELAPKLNLTEAAVKKAVSRMRAKYREFLRQEIAQTVSEPEEVDEEIRDLFRVFQT